jgi:hypothetical protein
MMQSLAFFLLKDLFLNRLRKRPLQQRGKLQIGPGRLPTELGGFVFQSPQ